MDKQISSDRERRLNQLEAILDAAASADAESAAWLLQAANELIKWLNDTAPKDA